MCIVILRLVQSVFLRSFVLFTIGLHSTPKKIETISTATFYMVRRQAGSAEAFITQRGEYDSMRSESFRRANIDHVSV